MTNQSKQRGLKLWVLLLALFFLFPGAGQACSVCLTGKEGSLIALVMTTVFLISLPLLLGGGLFLYVRKKYKEREIEEAKASEATT